MVVGASGVAVTGTYEISNNYQAVTFTPSESCGENSCGENMWCLPPSETLNVTMKSPATTVSPPQADLFPYAGVVDMAGNSLDGNNDNTAGDNYTWSFTTTGDIQREGPKIVAISPNVTEENVPLDQPVTLTFDGLLMTSSVSQDTIQLSNKELSTNTSHEMWYTTNISYLTANAEAVSSSSEIPAQTLVTLPHGTFLESVDGKSYVYGTSVTSGVKNEYQNCYVPAEGPDAQGGACGVTATEPFCCNGAPSATACTLF
jgi:hypothetical protein